MAKRFITTELFKDAWFMDLPNKYKLFWIFLITDCDHAGVWQVNYKTATFYVGDHLEPGECERFLKDRFIKIEEGKYWFIPKFIDFQYRRELNFSNRAVRSVIEVLKKYNLFEYLPKTNITEGASKELASTLKGVKDKDKDKDKEKTFFDEFIKVYPGTKRGLETEFKDFKKHNDWKTVLPMLKLSLENQIKIRENQLVKDPEAFIPDWKNLRTWLNQRSWEEEIVFSSPKKSTAKTEIGRVY